MKRFLVPASLALVLFGCDGASENRAVGPNDSRVTSPVSSADVLDSAKQLDDPYTVENMKAALNSLGKQNTTVAARAAALEQQIQANSIYVRFLPRGKRQKDALRKGMGDIPLFDHPLDYKSKNRWKKWVDSSLPDSTFAYYATVPVDFAFNDSIPYEKIKSLFLVQPILAAQDAKFSTPLARKQATTSVASSFENAGVDLAKLEMTSRALTGNAPAEATVAGRAAAWYSKWRPTGTITYADDVLGNKPVVGVRVTAGYSYYWRSSTTDGNGYFYSPERWYWSCQYELHWDADDFLMENGESSYGEDLMIYGPEDSYDAWNTQLTGTDAKHAAIFAAAFNYYYREIDGLERPRRDDWASIVLDLEIHNSNAGDALGQYENTGATEYIGIWLKNNDSYMASDVLYGNTSHELAHAAHCEHFVSQDSWTSRSNQFSQMDLAFKETWARGVEVYLTRKVYPNFSASFYNHEYTGIIEDLMDDGRTRSTSARTGITTIYPYGYFANNSGTRDGVVGFSIAEIQSQILGSYSLEELRVNLSTAFPPNLPYRVYNERKMEELFNHWTSVTKEYYP
jgi:hypothetical protein